MAARTRVPVMTLGAFKTGPPHEYAMQAVSGAYENWYRPAYYMDDDEIYRNARQKAADIYDQLQINVGLHPDILLLLSSDASAIPRVRDYLMVSGVQAL